MARGARRQSCGYEFRFRLEPQVLRHGEELLRADVGIIVEFGSWTRKERNAIRQRGVRTGAAAELHFMDAPLDELSRRVRQQGGEHAPFLVDKVLREYSGAFERPCAGEIAAFDRRPRATARLVHTQHTWRSFDALHLVFAVAFDAEIVPSAHK